MEDRRVEIVIDLVSPNAYLAWWPLRDICDRNRAGLDVMPVFLGGMHKLTGNAPPMIRDADVKGKVEYAELEFERFIRRHDLSKFRMHPAFPFNSLGLQRMMVAADQDGRGVQFADAMLRAIWEGSLDVNDADAVAGAIAAAGFDADYLAARAADPSVKQALIDNTEGAVERGAFGIPTFFVDGEIYFGKERLGQVEDQLAAPPHRRQ